VSDVGSTLVVSLLPRSSPRSTGRGWQEVHSARRVVSVVIDPRKPELRPADIGERARMIRRRRGMSLTVAAGLAGISKGYLSMLENGERRFERRSLIDRLAEALGCSALDLTGQPYQPVDRRAADAMAAIPDIELSLYDCTLDDVPDEPVRSIDELAELVRAAQRADDECRIDVAGQGIGRIMTELQIIAAKDGRERQRALGLLAEVSWVAYAVAVALGHVDLALVAAQRGYEAAERMEDVSLMAFITWYRTTALQRVGARRRVTTILDKTIDQLEPAADPTVEQPVLAELYGMLHLHAGLHAAKLGQAGQAHDHLDEAFRMAERTGERNAFRMHFGPVNASLWRLAVGVELEEGAQAYEAFGTVDVVTEVLPPDRLGAMHADLARALAQEGGPRDWDAIRHLDQADRIAPIRMRHDPIARELVASLDNRARAKTWELSSLRHRFGLS
jgi:transcriptional regulator with XRE-family HTH domain